MFPGLTIEPTEELMFTTTTAAEARSEGRAAASRKNGPPTLTE
jgi:hypothetical protein